MKYNEFFSKEEYDYLVHFSLVNIIGFYELQSNKINEYDIVYSLNLLFNDKYTFNQDNVIALCKKVFDDKFNEIIEKMENCIIDSEFSLTEDIFNKIEIQHRLDYENGNYKNRGDEINDYQNGKYYNFFNQLYYINKENGDSRNSMHLGESIYHSFARFYSLGIDEYIKYFKIMKNKKLINYKNQNQEGGFCNCTPCYYWFLNSKKDLEYFNDLIINEPIKLNHIEGNEHGPSALSIIIKRINSDTYYNIKDYKTIEIDNEYRNLLFDTLINLIKSNYSIAYDYKEIIDLFENWHDNDKVKEAIEYITSDIGIINQKENNKYPIVTGDKIDTRFNEQILNEKLDLLVNHLKVKKTYQKQIKKSF